METKEVPKHVRLATKLIILQQCQLELLDELKDTSLYRLDIRNLTNNLTTKLEKHLEKYLNTLDDEEKDLSFTSMQRASHKLLEISLEELHLMDELNANEK
jgi:plasmid maintenance system killer protein